jgi:hypothetical protein
LEKQLKCVKAIAHGAEDGSRYFQIKRKQKHYTPRHSQSGARLIGSPPVCRGSMNLLLFEGLQPHLLAGQWALRSWAAAALVSRTFRGHKRSKLLIPLKIKREGN